MALNKVALVTGAGQGIGRAIALRLAKDGFDVAINDLNAESATKVSKEIVETGRKSLVVPADVSDRDQVGDMARQVEHDLGGLDVWVSNAGIAQVKLLAEVTSDDFDKLMAVNVKGVLNGIQAASEIMKKRQKGKIINAASIAGHKGMGFLGLYSATKFAVVGLTHAAADELSKYGITVNAYCPGIVGTDMWDLIDERLGKYLDLPQGESLKKYSELITLGRVQTPEDVANFVSYLASDDSDYMTGQSINIDGGILFS